MKYHMILKFHVMSATLKDLCRDLTLMLMQAPWRDLAPGWIKG